MKKHLLLMMTLTAPWLVAQAPAPPPPLPFREGTVEASFVGTTGNSTTQSIGYGSELILRPAPWATRFKANYVRNKVGGVKSAEAFTGLARGERKFVERASFFAQYAFLADKFAGTNSRHTADAGISGQLIQREFHVLSADVSGGYSTDKRVAGSGVSTAIASVGSLYKWKVSPSADFAEEIRVVVAVPGGGDWRSSNTASIAAKISTLLSLKVANTVRYVNLPVAGFNTTDVITSIAIVAKF
jgi:putative salt-induced outer membrane protein